jgi:hypothetical protein
MKSLRCGLIGDYIGQTRFPAALQLMCQEAGIELGFGRAWGQRNYNF